MKLLDALDRLPKSGTSANDTTDPFERAAHMVPAMRKLLGRLNLQPADKEDLEALCLEAVVQSAQKWDNTSKKHFSNHAYWLLRETVSQYLGKRNKEQRTLTPNLPVSVPVEDTMPDLGATGIIEQLSSQDQRLVALHLKLGTHAKVAEHLGITTNALELRWRRLLKRARRLVSTE